MTLEDFFTLTEMKKGLATHSRVEELINTIRQQKKCSVNTISDATRQWTSVAATIAATENEDCLNYFVKLNGLSYLSQWIQQVLEHGNYCSDSIAEEFLSILMGLLEKLPVFKEDPASSEIQTISEKMIGLNILNIEERAKALSERWKHAMEVDASYQNLNNDKKDKDDNLDAIDCQKPVFSVGCPLNGSQLDKTADLSTEKVSKEIAASAISEDIAALPNAIVLNFSEVNFSGDVNEDHHDASTRKVDNPENRIINEDTEQVSPSKSDVKKVSQVLLPFNLSAPSIAHKPERSMSCNFDVKKNSNALKSVMALPRSASIDCDLTKHMHNISLKRDMQDLLSNGSSVKSEDFLKDTSCDNMEIESGGTSEVKVYSSKSSVNKSALRVDHTLDFGLEYGEIDALEVARQVAIEVAREVVDYREPFCSSSPDCSSREDDVGPKCPDRHHSKQVNEDKKDLDNSTVSDKTDITPDKCEQDVNMSSKQTTQEAINETNKNKHVFDLNEDICIEESDSVVNSNTNNSANISISTPIAVAASKGSPALPATPLQFEGELGWKGSAATSAFRSTSSRRTDVQKTLSGQKRKAVFIEFDLNIADKECDPDPLPVNPVTAPSHEDSIEVSSKRPENMKLDLNQIGDEETSQPQVQFAPSQNMALTMSPASSSSKERRMRDFDLNDNPNFFDVMGSNKKHEISIMGSKITEKKDHMSEPQRSSFGNGPNMVMPYGNFPLHPSAYNGSMMGHLMAFPMPHHTNGHMPYMVDSRGAPVVPQLFSNMGLNANPPSVPHFLMSLNGAGTSQPGLDMNSMENGNFRNFFMQGRIGLTEEQVRAASQPQGTMNRKEANTGREPYNFMASWQ